MSYFKGETKSFSGSPGSVQHIQVHASGGSTGGGGGGGGGQCVFPNQSRAIVQSAKVNAQLFKQVAWKHWSCVLDDQAADILWTNRWAEGKMWRSVCMCLCVHTHPWLCPCIKRLLVSAVCVCMCVNRWASHHRHKRMKPTNTPIHTLSYTQIQGNPLKHTYALTWWDYSSSSAHTLLFLGLVNACVCTSNSLTELLLVSGIQREVSQP